MVEAANDLLKRHGLVHVSSGGAVQVMRLLLQDDVLCVQREMVVYAHSIWDNPDKQSSFKERRVEIEKDPNGTLGVSIKGGREYGTPTFISKIIKESPADRCGMLRKGDSIIKVNGISVESMTHDEVVRQAKLGGNTVHFVIRRFQPSSQFMTLQGGNIDRRRATALCQNVTETQWCTLISVPLKYAYVTRSLTQRNVFEVFALDGHSTSALQCINDSVTDDWLRCIQHNINKVTRASLLEINAGLPANSKVHFVTWLSEKVISKQKCSWVPRFFALKGDGAYLFEVPPVYVHDWCRQVTCVHKIYECYCQLAVDAMYSEHDRPHCVQLYTGSDKPKTLALQTARDVQQFMDTWKHVSYTAVKHVTKRARYNCTFDKKPSVLYVDFEQQTFTLRTNITVGDRKMSHVPAGTPQNDPNFVWQYRFAQLRSSADDGQRMLKLHFTSALQSAPTATRAEQAHVDDLLNEEIDLIQFDDANRPENDDDEGFLSMGTSSQNGHNGNGGHNGNNGNSKRNGNGNGNGNGNAANHGHQAPNRAPLGHANNGYNGSASPNDTGRVSPNLLDDVRHGAIVIETHTIESGNMRLIMNAIHAFLEAKLVDLDPAFLHEAEALCRVENATTPGHEVKEYSGIVVLSPDTYHPNKRAALKQANGGSYTGCQTSKTDKQPEPAPKKEMRDEAVNTDFIFSMRGFW